MTTHVIMNVDRPNGSGGTYKAGVEYDLADDLAALWRGQGVCRLTSVRSEQTGAVITATSGNFPDAPALNKRIPLEVVSNGDGRIMVESLTYPGGFDWPQKYLVNFFRAGQQVWSDFVPEKHVDPRCYTGPCYQVDFVSGSDTNTGFGAYLDDWSNSLKSLSKAITLANTAGVPCRIRIRYRGASAYSPRVGGAPAFPTPTVPVLVEGVGAGRPKIRVSDDLTWTLVSGTTYKATRSNVSRVFNTTGQLDGDGNYPELKNVAGSAGQPLAARGTWAQVGSDVYVSLPLADDGGTSNDVVSNANCACTLVTNGLQVTQATPGGCGFFNLDIEGGYPVDVMHTSAAAADRKFVFKNVVARYSHVGFNNWRLRDSPGLIALIECGGFKAGADSFNEHWTLGGACTMYTYIERPKSRYNGLPGNQSNNSETGHGTVRCISMCPDYGRSFGGEVAYIGDSQLWIIEPRVFDSLGDIVIGGGISPATIWTQGNAQVWIDGGSLACVQHAINAQDNSIVRYRGTRVISGALTTSGNARIETYL